MATPQEQRRRLEEQRQRLQQKAQQNKPPAIGTKRADGKIYSGQNYGYQSPAAHKKLKNEGKFKVGAQPADRLQQSTVNALRKIADSPVGRAAQKAQKDFVKATNKIPGIQQLERTVERAATSTPQARASQGASALTQSAANKLNIDPRVAAAGLLFGQLTIGRAGSNAKPTGRLDGRPGVVPKHKPATIAQAKAGVAAAATRQGGTKLQGTRQLPPKAGPDGQRLFTPANRAAAVQRANTRGTPEGRRGDLRVTNNALGIKGMRNTSYDSSGVSNDIAFSHTPTKVRIRRHIKNLDDVDPYGDRQSIGDTLKSKSGEKIRKAGLKDQMGRLLDIKPGQSITASPTTRSRAVLYSRSTSGALTGNPRTGQIDSTRQANNVWRNNERPGQTKTFDPNKLREPLNKLTQSKATLVGRKAGGNSKVQASRVSQDAPARQAKPLLQKGDFTDLNRKLKIRELADADTKRRYAAQQEARRRGDYSDRHTPLDTEVVRLIVASGRGNLAAFSPEERLALIQQAERNLRGGGRSTTQPAARPTTQARNNGNNTIRERQGVARTTQQESRNNTQSSNRNAPNSEQSYVSRRRAQLLRAQREEDRRNPPSAGTQRRRAAAAAYLERIQGSR